MKKHPSLERTSPKGDLFIGRCPSCGKENLSLNQISEPCEGTMTTAQALLRAVKG